MPSGNDTKLKQTLAQVLGVPESGIGDETSMDTVPQWDSLKHLNLVLAIEEQFGVSLTEEQSFEILSYPLAKAVLAEHGIDFAA
jgi:acyl carrier protein